MSPRILSTQFLKHFDALEKNITAELPELDQHVGKVKHLKEIHDIAAKFPVWPFDWTSLRKFAIAWLSPIALTVVSMLLDRIF